jgi:hypothetical protein
MRFRARDVEVDLEGVLDLLDESFSDADRLERTYLILNGCDPDVIDALLSAQQVERRAGLRRSLLEGLREFLDVVGADVFDGVMGGQPEPACVRES